MNYLKEIKIENFRGIKESLTIDFVKGKKNTSVIIYGRNGSGKSSIVDAWEWLCSDKIESLSREGAGVKDYPHQLSKGENTYISIEFSEKLSILKKAFNPQRLKNPVLTGNFNEFIDYVKHPCHLRYRDLQSFVYKTKTEKYEYLAKYLGFENHIKIQNDLNAYLRKLSKEKESIDSQIRNKEIELKSKLNHSEINDENVINKANLVAKKYGVTEINSLKDLNELKIYLSQIIAGNPKSSKLSVLKKFKENIKNFFPISSMREGIKNVEELFVSLKSNQQNILNLLLDDLYTTGINTLNNLENQEICPLCDNYYGPELYNHINQKHIELEFVKSQKQEFDKKKRLISDNLKMIAQKASVIKGTSGSEIVSIFSDFFEKIDWLQQEIHKTLEKMNLNIIEENSFEISKDLTLDIIDDLIVMGETISTRLDQEMNEIEKDNDLNKLVNEYNEFCSTSDAYRDYKVLLNKNKFLSDTVNNFELVLDAFTHWVKENINNAFEKISNDVCTYFNILEISNEYLANPKIKLDIDKNKSVELEIELASEKITPAFKVLSESQVNSFGLAVFLAAIKNFNVDFKFIILDDVVNSFDAYKRPQILQLINEHFSDFQFLVLTHDRIWFDSVLRHFNNWNKTIFYKWDYSVGPKIKPAYSLTEEIEKSLEFDQPVEAGQKLGRYLEWTLQDINESFNTPIPYKIDNQYTISELFNPFKSRVKDKLKQNHLLFKKLNEFESKTVFRNYCAHWKNVETEFTTPEIKMIYNLWKEIEHIIYCDNCKQYTKYQNDLKCKCGNINLREKVYIE
jgi:energy-coupling factor transporter ATP-binding protein EcfA2